MNAARTLVVMASVLLMLDVVASYAHQVEGTDVWVKGSTVRVTWYPSVSHDSADVIVWDALQRRRIVLARSIPVGIGQAVVTIPDSLTAHSWYRLLVVGGLPPRFHHQDEHYRAVTEPFEKVTPEEPVVERDTSTPTVHPNPATNHTVVAWPWHDVSRILVRSVHGKVIGSSSIDSAMRMWTTAVTEWPVGVYSIELHRKRGIVRASLMVIR